MYREQVEQNYLQQITKKDESINNLSSNLTKYKNELSQVNNRLDIYQQDVMK